MRFLVAIDSFKDSLSSSRACRVVGQALMRLHPGATADECPLSDGGEGFLACLMANDSTLRRVDVTVPGPLGAPQDAYYALRESGGQREAFFEMALYAGLESVPRASRNPFVTTAAGLGEAIRHAAEVSRCTALVVGVGGSATNEGGISVARALGCRVQLGDAPAADAAIATGSGSPDDGERTLTGADTLRVVSIDPSPARDALSAVTRATFACDVVTPFSDAVAVYSTQKGARTEEARAALQRGMATVSDAYARGCGVEGLWDAPSGGAAGGVTAALRAVLGDGRCLVESGVEIMSRAAGLRDRVANADVIITGEGSYDAQTGEGKAPSLVMALAREAGKPVFVVCGTAADDIPRARGQPGGDAGPDAVVALTDHFPVDACMSDTENCIAKALETRHSDLGALLGLNEQEN